MSRAQRRHQYQSQAWRRRGKKHRTFARVAIVLVFVMLAGAFLIKGNQEQQTRYEAVTQEADSTDHNPADTGQKQAASETSGAHDAAPEQLSTDSYIEVNDNIPDFPETDMQAEPFVRYGELDDLGRCGEAYALLSKEMMPTDKTREPMTEFKPSGWHTVKYPELIEDRYLYNRCHLIAFGLTGDDPDERNLITGTRYLNVTGMLPFEEQVMRYLERTGNHVLYRVTPEFEGEELVARSVRMEAFSVEDKGEGICFHVRIDNVQPEIEIDYLTGESELAE